ncbi:MAG: hypothetical protein IKO39_08835 [Treponema sp.]|nr:hypothetical protein [Treponema sp.]
MRIINLVENELGDSGCAHNGILNVMETLERKFGSAMLPDLVIGGFHLMKRTDFSEADTAEVTEIANRLKGYKAHFATSRIFA